jgi:2,4-dienoyl-CoA reductase-like NADH-dependent reductase (Old Yellow Enzyme family)
MFQASKDMPSHDEAVMSPPAHIPVVFTPITIGNGNRLQLPNRIVMAPMTRRRAPGCVVGDDVAAYYARRAAGGVGLIITEAVHVNNTDAVDQENSPQCATEEQIAGWKRVVDACKEASGGKTKMCMQIWHTGLYSRVPVGPSDGIDVSNAQRAVALGRGATADDITRIGDEFARTALNAVTRCGFDTVQIHGAHGYFVDSFSSPVLNRRTDEYGQDDRSALAVEIIRKVRAALGDDVPVLYRLSQWIVTDYQHVKFPTSNAFGNFLSAIAKAGVDAIDVSTRRMLDAAFPEEHPTRTLAGWATFLLAQQQHAKKIYIIAVGSATVGRMFGEGNPADDFEVRDPTPAVELIESGEADLLGVGRALIADPEWVVKVQRGDWQMLTPYSTELLKVLA